MNRRVLKLSTVVLNVVLVSCLCITQPGREAFLERAIADFNLQTVDAADRELVIVANLS